MIERNQNSPEITNREGYFAKFLARFRSWSPKSRLEQNIKDESSHMRRLELQEHRTEEVFGLLDTLITLPLPGEDYKATSNSEPAKSYEISVNRKKLLNADMFFTDSSGGEIIVRSFGDNPGKFGPDYAFIKIDNQEYSRPITISELSLDTQENVLDRLYEATLPVVSEYGSQDLPDNVRELRPGRRSDYGRIA